MEAPTCSGNQAKREGSHLPGRAKGIINTKQAMRKKTLPNIPQKLPMLAIQKPMAEITKRIQPIKLIW
jgi:hypothetical protein